MVNLFQICGSKIRDSMDGGRTQALPARIAESGERRLARNLKKFRQNSNSNASGEPCSEILSPAKQS